MSPIAQKRMVTAQATLPMMMSGCFMETQTVTIGIGFTQEVKLCNLPGGTSELIHAATQSAIAASFGPLSLKV
jgi:hypothetical protein